MQRTLRSARRPFNAQSTASDSCFGGATIDRALPHFAASLRRFRGATIPPYAAGCATTRR